MEFFFESASFSFWGKRQEKKVVKKEMANVLPYVFSNYIIVELN